MAVKPEAKIYTDGACLGNPGPGGWACVVIIGDKERQMSGGQKNTTNNRMELIGVINGLRALRGPHIVTIYSDSQYVTNAINKGWLKSWKANGWTRNGDELKNAELWKELDALLQKHVTQFVWVKGHAGHYYNEICDKLASKQSHNYANGIEADWDNGAALYDGQQDVLSCELSAENILDAFEEFIRLINKSNMGTPAPCGALFYCDYCNDTATTHRCSKAYMTWREQRENK